MGAQIDAKRIYLSGLEKDPAIAESVKQQQEQQQSGTVGLGRLVKNSLQSLGDKIHQVIDSDPEATRRSQIAKTRDQIMQLEKSRDEAHAELGRFSEAVSREMESFRQQKDRDLTWLPQSFAQWLRKNIVALEDALVAIQNIHV